MVTYLKEDFNYDADLLVEDSLDSAGAVSAITASQAGKVLDVAKVIDMGDGKAEGYMICDIDAIVLAADENYEIKIQGTNTAAFGGTDIVDLAMVELGHADTLVGGSAIGAAGDRFAVPFRNVQNGTVYRYVRLYIVVLNGTAESITLTAWLSITRQNA